MPTLHYLLQKGQVPRRDLSAAGCSESVVLAEQDHRGLGREASEQELLPLIIDVQAGKYLGCFTSTKGQLSR